MGKNERVRLDRMKSDKYKWALDNILGANYSGDYPKESEVLIQDLVDKEQPRTIKEFPIVNRNNEVIVILKHCPRCNELITNRNNYCGHCGQALDWSAHEIL